ncbi:hypothetical protein GCM10010446_38730 [Streptomyces enissocaesilis]|uniref:Uncharacterized protein n=1 Tax=Streptomyces enissocaesilis TaxID=332589 RepID=A0ABP6JVR2_9ACTN
MKKHENDMDESRDQTQNHDGAQSCLQCTGAPLPHAGDDRLVMTFLRGRSGIGPLEFLRVR